MVQWGGKGAIVAKNSNTTSWHQLFSLIALVQPKLLSVLYINKMIRNAPKHYETHQNLSFVSNGVDQVRSLQKCPMRLRGPNFCVNCNIRPVLHRVLCSYEMITNAPKHYEMQKKLEFRVQWIGPGASILKNSIATSWFKLLD